MALAAKVRKRQPPPPVIEEPKLNTTPVKRKTYKPQNPLDLEATNANKILGLQAIKIESIRGPVVIGSKTAAGRRRKLHAYDHERGLKDKPIAHLPNGNRVFAFNAKGVPICFSKLRSFSTTGKRCQSPFIMPNGRCDLHGGNNKRGAEHPNATHLRTSIALPTYLQSDFRRAENDPDLLDMKHELKMLDTQAHQLQQEAELGLSETALKRLNDLINLLSIQIEKDAVKNETLEAIIQTWNTQKSREKATNKLHEMYLIRCKLAESMHKREKDGKYMLRMDKVMTLTSSLVSAAKESVANLVKAVEKRYILIDTRRLNVGAAKEIKEKYGEAFRTNIDPDFKLDFLGELAKAVQRLTSGDATNSDVASIETLERDNATIIEANYKLLE